MIHRLVSKLRPSLDAPESPACALVDRLFDEGIGLGASDLHVEPAEAGGRVRFRVDGFFREGAPIDRELFPKVQARIKVLAELAVFRTGEPQDGRIRFGTAELRVSTIPVLDGEKTVIRFFDRAGAPRTLPELGLGDEALASIRRLLSLPAGAVFVVAPASSGKTTTLYAMSREILAAEGGHTNVVSAEDPVEQRVLGMSQSEVDLPRGVDFPALLRAHLRQDPEVLFVTETRDPETARIVVEAAFTGHRVFSSLHVGSAAEIPHRLEALGVPRHLIVEALRGAIVQRLVRRPCGECAAAGCAECGGSGHRGRRAVAEVSRFESGAAVRETPTLEEAAAVVTTEAELHRVFRRGAV